MTKLIHKITLVISSKNINFDLSQSKCFNSYLISMGYKAYIMVYIITLTHVRKYDTI